MPKPIVIELKDGEVQPIEMHWRHYKTHLDFHADIREGDEEDVAALHGVHVQGCLRGCFGPLAMRPDPVRAAVKAATERCKAIIRDWVDSTSAKAICAAINAPAEPASEYEAGQVSMQRRMISEARAWLPLEGAFVTRDGFDNMLASLDKMFVLTEPTA